MNTRNVMGIQLVHGRLGGLRGLLPALLVLGVSGILLVGLSNTAEARRGGGPMGAGDQAGMMRGMGGNFLAMAEELNLTEDQITRLKDIRKSAPAKIMPKRQALMEARIDYRDVMADANADTKTIRAAHKRLLDAQSALKAASFDLRLEARDVLTPEQRAELKKHVRQRVRERMRRPRQMRMHRQGWNGQGDRGETFGVRSEAFGPLGPSYDSLDEDLDFFGMGPAWDTNVDGTDFFWLQEDREETPEGASP